jgi:hypothetical protein
MIEFLQDTHKGPEVQRSSGGFVGAAEVVAEPVAEGDRDVGGWKWAGYTGIIEVLS